MKSPLTWRRLYEALYHGTIDPEASQQLSNLAILQQVREPKVRMTKRREEPPRNQFNRPTNSIRGAIGMQYLDSPFHNPIWQGLARETDLAAQLIYSGANEIGRAEYTTQGKYTAAQFGFSNGLERLGKIILTCDHLISHGKPLNDRQLRRKGHSISEIYKEVAEVADRKELEVKFEQPTSTIASNTLTCFDDFAAASRGRYANHASLTGNRSPYEPTAHWWSTVCEPILDKHFRGTKVEERAIEKSTQVGAILTNFAVTLYFHEDGSPVTDPAKASLMTHERKVTQRWGRYYSLIHARWMSEVFRQLTYIPGHAAYTEFLFGHHERIQSLRVPDDDLRNRKSWPIQ